MSKKLKFKQQKTAPKQFALRCFALQTAWGSGGELVDYNSQFRRGSGGIGQCPQEILRDLIIAIDKKSH